MTIIIKNKALQILKLRTLRTSCTLKMAARRSTLKESPVNTPKHDSIFMKALEKSELEIEDASINGLNPQENSLLKIEELYRNEIEDVLKYNNKQIENILLTNNNNLNNLTKYYIKQNGKMIRPTIVLLMSKATSLLAKNEEKDELFEDTSLNKNSKCYNGQEDYSTLSKSNTIKIKRYKDSTYILPKQQRLAQITELIHAASLFHDDVIDNAVTRRNMKSVNVEFDNKLSILGGDFLLSRASVSLARLNNLKCVELLATVISNLVEGELIQLNDSDYSRNLNNYDLMIDRYIHKIYLKTASLFANSCQASVILNSGVEKNKDSRVEQIAFEYGKNIGLAFQIMDDLLDILGDEKTTGKQLNLDFENNVLTLPLIMAIKENNDKKEEIIHLLNKKDTIKIRELIFNNSNSIQNCKNLALQYSTLALKSISSLPNSTAKQCLENICTTVIHRNS